LRDRGTLRGPPVSFREPGEVLGLVDVERKVVAIEDPHAEAALLALG
jgi:hypothetical protein